MGQQEQEPDAESSQVLALQSALLAEADNLLRYIRRNIDQDLRKLVDPSDILQDVFFEAFRGRSELRIDNADSVRRWLFTIAHHRILALVRMQRRIKRGGDRRPRRELGAVMTILEELAVYTRTPSQSAMSHEVARSVQNSMARLDPQYRQVIQLRYIDGLSPAEAADRMGRTKRAIHMLCHRGLKQLKVEMKSASLVV